MTNKQLNKIRFILIKHDEGKLKEKEVIKALRTILNDGSISQQYDKACSSKYLPYIG